MRTLHISFCLFLLLFVASISVGQGTRGYLPDPISTQQLAQYADRLGLSDQQRHAAEAMHLDYVKEFQALREKQIAPFMGTRFFDMREFHKARDPILNSIKSLDQKLLDQLATILSVEQSPALPRVQQMRKLDCLMSFSLWWSSFNAQPINVGDLLIEAKPSPEELAAADSILHSYEVTLIQLIEKLERQYEKLTIAQEQALDAAGLKGETRYDQANYELFRSVTAPVLREHNPGIRTLHSEIAEVHRKTFNRIVQSLSPEAATRFRQLFIFKAYDRIYFSAFYDDRFKLALQRKGLTDDQVATIRNATEQQKKKLNNLFEEGADLVDNFFSRYMSYRSDLDPDGDAARKEFEAKLQDLQERAVSAHREGQKTLVTLFGPEWWVPEPLPIEEIIEGNELNDYASLMSIAGIAHDSLLQVQKPINQRELREIADQLKLDEAQRTAIASLHATYLEQFEVFRIHQLLQAKQAASLTREDGKGNPTQDAAVRYEQAARAAIQEAHRIDSSFLDSIEQSVLNSQQTQRVRLARQRQWYNRGMHGGAFGLYGPGGNYEANLDLSNLVHKLAVDPNLDDQRWEYEQALTPLLKSKFDSCFENDCGDIMVRARRAELMVVSGPDHYPDMSAAVQELCGAALARIEEVNQAIIALNRETIAKWLPDMPAESAAHLKRSYDRLSNPKIYADEIFVGGHLSAALRLPDLSDAQRIQIEELCASFHPAYDQLCQRMLESIENRDSPIYSNSRTSDAEGIRFQARQSARVKLSFDRHELNVRTLHHLRGILTPDQIDKLNGLPDPPAFDEQTSQFGM
jgi:hypothetical protein